MVNSEGVSGVCTKPFFWKPFGCHHFLVVYFNSEVKVDELLISLGTVVPKELEVKMRKNRLIMKEESKTKVGCYKK